MATQLSEGSPVSAARQVKLLPSEQCGDGARCPLADVFATDTPSPDRKDIN